MVLVPIYADDGVTQLTDDAGNILLVEDGTAGLLTFVSQQDFFAIARAEQAPLFRMPRFADSLPPPLSGGGGGGTFFLNVGVIFQLPPPKGQVIV